MTKEKSGFGWIVLVGCGIVSAFGCLFLPLPMPAGAIAFIGCAGAIAFVYNSI